MEIKEALFGADGIECRILYHHVENLLEERIPVVFLHGYSFTGETWIKSGIARKMYELGIPSVYPDMPYGRISACTKKTRNIDINVKAVEEIVRIFLKERRPLLVGASLGGRVALYYALSHPVEGLFLASPALKDDEKFWNFSRLIKSPAIIIRGGNDFVPKRIHRKLSEKIKAKLIIYEDAGHAMYLDNPEKFVNDLLLFYESLSV